MDYKTPGIFIEEVSIFPPSVAGVATAVPAFIGYTELVANSGASLVNKPTRLSSLLEFTTLFGGVFNPAKYTIQVDPAASFNILEVAPADGNKYYLFDAMRHYFDNGGGPCYVVTVGSYDDDIIYGTDTTGLRGGLRSLEKVDEPTILAIPDSVSLRQSDGSPDFVKAGNLHKDIIDQCGRLQDRFGILDMVEGYRAPDYRFPDPAFPHPPFPGQTLSIDGLFRSQVGTENLNYAAVYYPWLSTTYLKDVTFSQLDLRDPTLAVIADSVIDTMTSSATLDGLVTTLRAYVKEESNIYSKITVPAVSRNNYTTLTSQFIVLKNAVMTATTAAAVRPLFSALMGFVRQLALAFRDLEDDAGNSPELISQLTSLKSDTSFRAQLISLIAFEKNINVMNSISTVRAIGDVETDYASLDTQDWIGGVTISSIVASTSDFTNGGANTIAQTAQAAANAPELRMAFDKIVQAYVSLVGDAIFRTNQAEKNLFTQHPFFKAVYDRVRKDMSLLPPSGAVAGVYASIDRTRGVWKSPANVSLRSVVAPAYKLTDQEQSTLNVHDTGKSINAIRAFTGKGNLIWGARTLSGNDNEWRYINVRRFFIFVEESTKKASQPFVFEQNDANTWIRIRAMIENFLTIQWRQGALAGSTRKDAFFVKVGLNETMTALDILEGRLIVEIGLAAVRPAEFIVLRFSHKMQES